MSEVVKHWGIKIEAVELNNVVIMDVNLFKDFQVAFQCIFHEGCQIRKLNHFNFPEMSK